MKLSFQASLLGAALLASAAAADAADYAPLDCSRAVSPAQRTICSDYRLGQLEARMATLFEWATAFVAMGRRGQMQDDQRAFLEAREPCGADVACLASLYAKRIEVLEDVMNDVRSRGPF